LRSPLLVLKDAWLVAAIFVLGFAFAIAVSYAASFVTPSDRTNVVIVFGLVLQLLGLGVVLVGIRKLRRQFSRRWFRRLRESLVSRNVVISVPLGGVSARGEVGSVVVGDAVDATVEQRLEVMKSELERLRRDVDTKVEAAVKTLQERLQREEAERTIANAAVLTQVEEAVVGFVNIEGVGVVWLIVGVFVATVPEWIVTLFERTLQ
jgi:hypothetical protein